MITSAIRGLKSTIIVTLLIVTISQPISFADEANGVNTAQISLDISDGYHIYEMSDGSSTSISGIIQDEKAPISATSELLDSFGTRHYVDFTDNLELESGPGSWKEWSFDIEINPLIVGPCSCTLVITIIDEMGNIKTELMSIFISPNADQLPPTIHFNTDTSEKWYSQRYIVNAISRTWDSSEPVFEYTLRNSTNVKCSDVESQQMDLPDLKSPNSSQFSYGVDDDGQYVGPLSFNIDLDDYSDGWYDLVIYATDPTNQKSSYDCTSFRVDNTPPVAIIEGPSTISEGNAAVLIDGSSSNDVYWGIQGLTYIWTVIDIEGSSYSETIFVMGKDERSINIFPSKSGKYEIKLAIADQAGNIGSNIQILEIQNLAPIAKLTIDNEPISNNAEFTMSRDSTYAIDASGSTDTQNDADSLRYIWRINNIPTYEGASRDFSWPEGVSQEFILTIEVMDDDSESTQISILIKDDSTSSISALPIIVLILSALFFSYSLVNLRKQANESDIPKWS